MRLLTLRILIILLVLSSMTRAADSADEEAAVQAIRGVASNIQMNRDGTVRFVRFSRPNVTDEDLGHLNAFRKIDYLAVVTPTITDAGLGVVAVLSNLDTLYVSNTQLTDAGMAALADLEKLERLYLDGTQITDAGLAHLASVKSLTTLSLQRTKISDAGLEHLRGLEQLEVLSLAETKITDAGLVHLAGLKELRTLSLSGTAITGTGLEHLKPSSQLEILDLSGTQVNADGLEPLAGVSSLKHILLYSTSVAREAVAAVQTRLPKTAVRLSPPAGEERDALRRFLDGKLVGTTAATQTSPDHSATLTEEHPILAPPRERFTTTEDVPDFQRHVIPLLGRLGCNGRTCHGSFQGQGGFRLSMFGYDFDADLEALTGGEDPRVNVASPDESLVILKPTMQEEHEGGERYAKGSWEHHLLRRWIAAGAKGVSKEAPKLVRLDVTPAEVVFKQPGESVQLRAIAVWSDGTREDVTCLTRFQTNDETVAEVTPDGEIRSIGPGDTYVVSFYDNAVVSSQVLLPVTDRTGERYPNVPAPTKIDELVVAKLSKLGIVPSEVCSDEEFLRRVGLDLAGTLPTPEEVRAFLADPSPDKRSLRIDELLERPAYVEWWTNLLCDLTGCNAQHLGSTDMNRPAAEQWREWIRRRLLDNVSWDKIAAGVLLATSRRPGQTYDDYAAEQSAYLRTSEPADFTALDNPMHYYWFRGNLGQPTDRALSFGYVFLGVRLECAQCHKHPFDEWSKQDFELFTEFFTRIKAGVAPDAAEAQRQLKIKLGVPAKLDTAALRRVMYMQVAAEGQPIPWNEVYIEEPKGKPQPARLLGGEEMDLSRYEDPREPLVAWLLKPDNPYFARAFVNRVWAHYFNTGIVEPADDFNRANPPSNKALLDHLAGEFVKHGYDIKWLHRAITNSRTYQLSWKPNETNRGDERNFSHAIIRRLPAEVVVDAILQATADDRTLEKLAAGVDGRKIAQHPLSIQARAVDYSLLVFGKPLRTTNCDCERQMQPTLLQSLYVRNDHELLGWLERKDGWLVQVARELEQTLSSETVAGTQTGKERPPNEETLPTPEVIDELIETAYLRTLSRLPHEAEQARARRQITEATNTVEGLRDVMWALLNTQEFLTNH